MKGIKSRGAEWLALRCTVHWWRRKDLNQVYGTSELVFLKALQYASCWLMLSRTVLTLTFTSACCLLPGYQKPFSTYQQWHLLQPSDFWCSRCWPHTSWSQLCLSLAAILSPHCLVTIANNSYPWSVYVMPLLRWTSFKSERNTLLYNGLTLTSLTSQSTLLLPFRSFEAPLILAPPRYIAIPGFTLTISFTLNALPSLFSEADTHLLTVFPQIPASPWGLLGAPI
jgi:hypothetical protein